MGFEAKTVKEADKALANMRAQIEALQAEKGTELAKLESLRDRRAEMITKKAVVGTNVVGADLTKINREISACEANIKQADETISAATSELEKVEAGKRRAELRQKRKALAAYCADYAAYIREIHAATLVIEKTLNDLRDTGRLIREASWAREEQWFLLYPGVFEDILAGFLLDVIRDHLPGKYRLPRSEKDKRAQFLKLGERVKSEYLTNLDEGKADEYAT